MNVDRLLTKFDNSLSIELKYIIFEENGPDEFKIYCLCMYAFFLVNIIKICLTGIR